MEERKIFVGKTNEIPVGQMKKFRIGPRGALVVNTGAVFKAFYDTCTHQAGPMKIRGGRFQCQWHQATFELATGRALTAPAPEGSVLTEIPLTIEGEDIFTILATNDPD